MPAVVLISAFKNKSKPVSWPSSEVASVNAVLQRPVHTSKFKRIRCASNANWSRSHCALSDAHQLNAHSM